MFKKTFLVIMLITIIVVGITQKDTLIGMIIHGGSPAIIVSILLLTICVFFPVVPFAVSTGIIGAVFGTIQGAVISLSGSMFGTILLFFITRYGFREWAQQKLKKYPKVQEYEEFLNRKSFLAILTARLIPVIPAPVVNIVCGLSNVNWVVFIIASAFGKIPNIFVLSYAGANLHHNKWVSILMYSFYLVIIVIINFILVYRKIPKNMAKTK
ncbi:TVP38/TMEM64 family protein [Neobacillus ginsengisoli]|uniref:TVP38/TMEM64 family membrane protein n=1 Tax=Neobacillus ginsengisoli TaxID=904295 RepID=A0ABT9XTR8_9BACI|nr:TVP38/TMEM64 family protein [Neobacillus ginsengisoli]MDQ0198675.1 putative membrane protein YdjX (TVP38/TMEM64 family) [Neobacillus ginsengisoli]